MDRVSMASFLSYHWGISFFKTVPLIKTTTYQKGLEIRSLPVRIILEGRLL